MKYFGLLTAILIFFGKVNSNAQVQSPSAFDSYSNLGSTREPGNVSLPASLDYLEISGTSVLYGGDGDTAGGIFRHFDKNRYSALPFDSKTESADSNFYQPDYEITDDEAARYTYTFDVHGNMLSKLRERRSYLAWTNSWFTWFAYDDEGRMLTKTQQYWNIYFWADYERLIYSYDSVGRIAVQLLQYQLNARWVDKSRKTFSYSSDGKLTTILEEIWGNNGNYTNLFSYTYDERGNLVMLIYQLLLDGSVYNKERWTCTSDDEGRRLTTIYEEWVSNAWKNFVFSSNSYDSTGNVSKFLEKFWADSVWGNTRLTSYTYDERNYRTASQTEYWDDTLWVNGTKEYYSFDANGNCTQGDAYLWSAGAWIHNAAGSLRMYYNNNTQSWSYESSSVSLEYASFVTDNSELSESEPSFALSQNFPNPFNPATAIRFSLPIAGFVTLKVFDILGSEIATLVNEYKSAGEYDVQFNSSHLPSGTYFYRLTSGAYSETRKMLLLK